MATDGAARGIERLDIIRTYHCFSIHNHPESVVYRALGVAVSNLKPTFTIKMELTDCKEGSGSCQRQSIINLQEAELTGIARGCS